MKHLILLVMIIGCSELGMAHDDFLMRLCEKEYRFATWGGKCLENYGEPIKSWRMPPLNIDTNGVKLVSRSSKEGCSEELWLFSDKQDLILLVKALWCPNVISAHRAIIEEFCQMTSTQRDNHVVGIGDQGFSYSYGDNWSSYIFARNNIKVSITSYVKRIQAKDVARQIDADILKKSLSREE